MIILYVVAEVKQYKCLKNKNNLLNDINNELYISNNLLNDINNELYISFQKY